MGDAVDFPSLPDLSEIDFSNTSDVRRLIRDRNDCLFGESDDCYIDDYIDAIEDLFSGKCPEYQAMDTTYHDITHTLQATLCLVELIYHRHMRHISPQITANDFRRSLSPTFLR